jgi:hypothetical protein
LLGWQPQTALKEGLIATIAYFEEILRDESSRALSRGSFVAGVFNVV